MDAVRGELERFFDGGPPGGRPDRGAPARILLERRDVDGSERFALLRRVGYDDRHLGVLLVPADLERFTTDLTSVPSVLTWLVPRTGRHLAAALVHDALVADRGEGPAHVLVAGRPGGVDRVTADRVFRDAMADTGTRVVRRWLAWSAVTLATLVVAPARQLPRWSAWSRWRYRLVAVGSLLLVAWLGWCASWDLVDRAAPLAPGVPWMPEGGTGSELLQGAAGAVAVPLALGLLWGRFRVAGVVLGIGLALLLHVTVLVGALTLCYRLVEAVATRAPTAAALLAGFTAAWALVLVGRALLA